MSAIPSTEVVAWLDLQGIRDAVVRRDYHDVIRVLDRSYLANRATWERQPDEDETQEEEIRGDRNKGTKRGKR